MEPSEEAEAAGAEEPRRWGKVLVEGENERSEGGTWQYGSSRFSVFGVVALRPSYAKSKRKSAPEGTPQEQRAEDEQEEEGRESKSRSVAGGED